MSQEKVAATEDAAAQEPAAVPEPAAAAAPDPTSTPAPTPAPTPAAIPAPTPAPAPEPTPAPTTAPEQQPEQTPTPTPAPPPPAEASTADADPAQTPKVPPEKQTRSTADELSIIDGGAPVDSKTTRKSIHKKKGSESHASSRRSTRSISSGKFMSGRKSITEKRNTLVKQRKKVKEVEKSDEISIAEDESSDAPSSDKEVDQRLSAMPSKQDPSKLSEYAYLDTESEKSQESECSYLQQKELEFKPDFFDELGEIPSVGEISLDVSMQDFEFIATQQSATVLDGEEKDIGKFVNPVTGEDEPEPEPEPSAVTEMPLEIPEEVADDQESVDSDASDFEEEDIVLPPEVEEEVKEKKVDDDGLGLWYGIDAPKIVQLEDGVDAGAFERLEAERKIKAQFLNMILELVDQVVDKCEYVDPNTILRQNLDKLKLMSELNAKMGELEIEQKARFFLNRKTVEYFRRKKAFRSIIEDNPDTITQAIEKYREATMALDQLLGRQEETHIEASLKVEELNSILFYMKERAEKSVRQLEDLVKTSLHRDHFDKLPGVVTVLLQRIADQREEISNVRKVLIQRQHTFAKLQEKSNKLENIGDGLHMRDFEHLQTETLALSKKIEERNTELNKLRTRCNADLHIMAHIKEKQQMLRNTIVIQEAALRELMDEKHSSRERLYMLKLDRTKIRKEIRELSFQGGLIDKPALMLDYDETVNRLETLREMVEQKRKKFDELQKRIQFLEEEQ